MSSRWSPYPQKLKLTYLLHLQGRYSSQRLPPFRPDLPQASRWFMLADFRWAMRWKEMARISCCRNEAGEMQLFASPRFTVSHKCTSFSIRVQSFRSARWSYQTHLSSSLARNPSEVSVQEHMREMWDFVKVAVSGGVLNWSGGDICVSIAMTQNQIRSRSIPSRNGSDSFNRKGRQNFFPVWINHSTKSRQREPVVISKAVYQYT